MMTPEERADLRERLAKLPVFGARRLLCPRGCGGRLYVRVVITRPGRAERGFACDTCDYGHDDWTEVPHA